MGNDPILSLSQSEVLNLYTMVTVIWLVSLAGFEPTPPDPKSGTLPDYAIERKLGGGRGYRTPLDILLARQNRSPLLPPYTGTQCWLRSNYSRLIKTVPHHSVYWAINTIMKTYKNFTPSGLNFHLSLMNGVCCMIVYDRFFCEYHMQYFTSVNKALRFINNL